ncbi:MAG: hypothetical protein FK734_16715 [Asgard group archaeon]|nr:hypothetical protein [Asgard group archaeon]
MTIENKKQRTIQLKYVFYAEGILNFIIFFICIAKPDIFIKQMTSLSYDQVTIEFVYWYGALLLVLTSMLIGILILENRRSFLVVLSCYLVGDLVQTLLAIKFAVDLDKWTTGIIITIVLSLVLAIFRIIILIKPKWLGFREEKKEKGETMKETS